MNSTSYIVLRRYDECFTDIVFVTSDREKAIQVRDVAQTVFREDYFFIAEFDDGEMEGFYEIALKGLV